MANNNPKLLITGSLNVGATVGEINKQLKEIAKKINKIKVDIEINDKMVSKLNAISNGMKNVKAVAQEMNKVLKQEETLVKNLDGTTDKLTRTYLKSGEVIEKTRKVIDKSKSSKEAEAEATRKLAEAEDKLGKKLQEKRKYDSQGNLTGTSSTYGDKNNNTTVNTNNKGKIIGSTQKINYDQQLQDQMKADAKQLAEQQKFLDQMASGRERANERILQEQRAHDKAMAQSINKAIEDEAKAREKEDRRVANLGNKLTPTSGAAPTFNHANFDAEKSAMEKYVREVYGVQDANVKLTKSFDTAGNAVWSYSARLKGLKNVTNVKGSIDQTTKALYEQQKVIQDNQKSLSIMDQFKEAMVKFPIWLGASTAIFGTAAALKEMVGVIVEVDTAMTDLKKVMSLDTNFDEVLQSAIDKGKEFGKTITDVLASYNTFAKQGFKADDLANMSDAALIASNVGDMDAAKSAEYLTSAIVQFKLETKDAISVVDAWNNISNQNATTIENLAQGTAAAGSTAKAFGVDMNQLNGIIGTVTEATRQSGTEVGNFVKNVLPRLNSTKAQDGLEAIGVAAKDSSGELRNATDIYADVAKKMDTLTVSQKTMVAESLAGKQHISRMLALLSNWGNYEKMVAESMNSKNSAMRENATYMQGMEAKINLLKQSFQQLALAIGSAVLSDGFVALVGGLTSLAKVGVVVTKTLGFLPVLFGSAGVAAVLFSTRVKTAALQSAVAGRAFAALGVEARAVQVALASTGVGLALVAVGFVAEKLISHFSKLHAEQQAAEDQIRRNQKTSAEALTDHAGEVNKLIARYKDLSNQQKNGGLDLTKQKELEEVTKSLADIYPNLISYVDAKGKAHLVEADEINKVNESTLKLINLEKERIKLQASEKLDKTQDKQGDIQNKIDDAQKKLNSNIKTVTRGGMTVGFSDKEKNKLQEQIVIWKSQLESGYSEINQGVIKLTSAFSNAKIDINPQIKQQVESFISSLDLRQINGSQQEKIAKKFASAIEDLSNAYDTKNTVAYNDAVNKLMDDLSNAGIKGQGFARSLDDNSGALRTFTDAQAKAVQVNGDMSQVLDADTSGIDGNTDALNANTGAKSDNVSMTEALYGITSDQIQQASQAIRTYQLLSGAQNLTTEQSAALAQATDILKNMFPGLSDNIKGNIGTMLNSISAYNGLNDASANTAQTLMANEVARTNQQAAQIKARIANMNEEIRAIQQLAGQYRRASQSLYSMATTNPDLPDNYRMRMLNQSKKLDPDFQVQQIQANIRTEQSNLNKITNKQTKVSSNYSSKYDSGGSSGSGGGGSSKGSSGKGSGSKGSGSKSSKDKGSSSKGKSSSSSSSSTPTALNKTKTEAEIDVIQEKIDLLETKRESMDELSSQYRKNIDDTIIQEKALIKKLEQEKKELTKKRDANKKKIKDIEKGGVSSKERDQYNKLINDTREINSQISDVAKSIVETQNKIASELEAKGMSALNELMKKTEAAVAKVDDKLRKAENRLKLVDLSDKDNKEAEKIKIINEEISALKEKKKAEESALASLQKQLKTKGLSKAVQAEINAQIKEEQELIDETNVAIAEQEAALRDVKSEAADIIIEAEKKAIEATKDSKLKAIEDERNAFNKLYEDKQKAYDKELDDIQKVYDAKIKALHDEKDTNDYNKELKAKQDEQQKIQDQLNKLALDDSLEAKAKREELMKELADKQTEIAEYVADHNLKLQEDALTAEQQLRQDAIQKEKDELDKYKESKENEWNVRTKQAEDAYNNIMDNEAYWAKKHDELMKGVYDGDLLKLTTFLADAQTGMANLSEGIRATLIATLQEAVDLTKSLGGKIPTKPPTGAKAKPAPPKIPKHHDGGIVGGSGTPIANFVNSLFNVKPGEQIIKALKGEVTIPEKNISNGLRNIHAMSSINSNHNNSPTVVNEYKFIIESFNGTKSDGEAFINYVDNSLKRRGLKL